MDEHIDNQSSSDDNLASYRLSDVFASYVKKNVSHDFYENDMDSDEEIWNNISIDDINLDLQTGADTTDNIMHVENVPNKNVKLGTLLIWFFMFLCTWQAVSALPDSAMNNLLSFLWTFLVKNLSFVQVLLQFSLDQSICYEKRLGLKKRQFLKICCMQKMFFLYTNMRNAF